MGKRRKFASLRFKILHAVDRLARVRAALDRITADLVALGVEPEQHAMILSNVQAYLQAREEKERLERKRVEQIAYDIIRYDETPEERAQRLAAFSELFYVAENRLVQGRERTLESEKKRDQQRQREKESRKVAREMQIKIDREARAAMKPTSQKRDIRAEIEALREELAREEREFLKSN